MVRCSACGSENPSGSPFCRKCARKLDAETRSQVERQRATALATQTTGIRWVSIAVSAILLLIAALIIFVVLAFVVH
jgi:uncharacterized membrane protein YvbJ